MSCGFVFYIYFLVGLHVVDSDDFVEVLEAIAKMTTILVMGSKRCHLDVSMWGSGEVGAFVCVRAHELTHVR